MTGLLIKDGYTMLRQSKFFLLLVLILAFLPSELLYGYAIFYSAILASSTLAYDERARWDTLVNMLPFTEGQIVGSKYIIGYLTVAFAMLLSICGKYANALISGQTVTAMDLAPLVFVVCAAVIIEAINLPFAFWIGVEKGRLVFVLFCVVSIVSLMSFIESTDFAQLQLNMPQALLAVIGITVASNLISFLVAKCLYRRKKA